MAERIRVQIALNGADQVRAAFSAIATAGGRAFGALRSGVGGIGENIGRLRDDIGKVTEALGTLARRSASIAGAGAGVAIGAAAAANRAIQSTATAADEAQRLANIIGGTPQEAGRLIAAFESVGGESQDLRAAFTQLTDVLRDANDQAQEGADKQRDAARALGEAQAAMARLNDEEQRFVRLARGTDDDRRIALEDRVRDIDRAERAARTRGDAAEQVRLRVARREVEDIMRGGAQGRTSFVEGELRRLVSDRERAAREIERATQGAQQAERVGDFAQAFADLGINVRSAAGQIRPIGELLPEIVRGFARIEDPVRRSGIAIRLFGEDDAAKMLPLINLGIERVRALGDEAERQGRIFSDRAAEALRGYTAAMRLLGSAAQGVRNEIGVALAPSFELAFRVIGTLLTGAREQVRAFGDTVAGQLLSAVRDLIGVVNGGGLDAIQTPWLRAIVDVFLEVRRVAGLAAETFERDVVPVFRDVVGPVSRAVGDALRFVAEQWNALTGSNATAGQVGFAAILFKIAGIFRLLGSIAGVAITTVRLGLSGILAVAGPLLSLVGRLAGIFVRVGGAAAATTGLVAGLGATVASLPAIIAGVIAAGVGLGVALASNPEFSPGHSGVG